MPSVCIAVKRNAQEVLNFLSAVLHGAALDLPLFAQVHVETHEAFGLGLGLEEGQG